MGQIDGDGGAEDGFKSFKREESSPGAAWRKSNEWIKHLVVYVPLHCRPFPV